RLRPVPGREQPGGGRGRRCRGRSLHAPPERREPAAGHGRGGPPTGARSLRLGTRYPGVRSLVVRPGQAAPPRAERSQSAPAALGGCPVGELDNVLRRLGAPAAVRRPTLAWLLKYGLLRRPAPAEPGGPS